MKQHPLRRQDHTAFIATTLLLLAALPALAIGMFAVQRAVHEEPEASILELVRLSRAFTQPVVKPAVVKGVYLTSNTAGSDIRRGEIFDMIDRTELNTAVIDIKTAKGLLAYPAGVQVAQDAGVIAENPYDLDAILADARSRGIYTIARLPVFEDTALAVARPDFALKTKGGGFWLNRKGVAWLDMTNEDVWAYTAALVNDALARGFNEVQLDYVRFPSDGDLSDAVYQNWSEDSGVPRYVVIGKFFSYIREHVPQGRLSADLFGLTMDASSHSDNDLFIGQRLGDGLASFDVISPMIYPSHYAPFYAGYQNPASAPGGVISNTLDAAQSFLETLPRQEGESPYHDIRPWLQDFNLGAIYTPQMVRTEIDTAEARGVDGWLLWDPGNTYTEAALKPASVLNSSVTQ